MFLIDIVLVEFEFLVGETEPEPLVSIDLQRFDASQQQNITNIEFDRTNFWSFKEDWIV